MRPRPTIARPPWEPGPRDVADAAWTLVRRDNAEVRKSHPRAYAWARAYLDAERRRPRV